MRRSMVAAEAAPTRRGLETTQIGGGDCTGISGPSSVPE